MANPAKQKGTSFETAIVRWFESRGIDAKRIVLHGNKDQGDVETEFFNVEAKNCNTLTLSTWVAEADVESTNANRPVVVVAKRKGTSDVGKAYVITTLDMFVDMMYAPGHYEHWNERHG
jgi:hypothetical protein